MILALYKDLGFEQLAAYCALEYIDKSAVDALQDQWEAFIGGSQGLKVDRPRQTLSDTLATIEEIRSPKNRV